MPNSLITAATEAASSDASPKNLKIDPELHRRLKVEAAARGVSLQALTEAALAVGLAAPELSQTLAKALEAANKEGTQ